MWSEDSRVSVPLLKVITVVIKIIFKETSLLIVELFYFPGHPMTF